MAFFKFPWSGNRADAPREKPARRSRGGAQAESVEDLRRRARHRLIGAVVLVLAAVIGLPLVFDAQPRPIPVNVAIDIPDRNHVAPLPPPAPRTPAPQLPADAGLDAGEEITPSRATAAAPEPRPQAKSEPKAEAKTEPKPAPRPEPQPPVEPKAETRPAAAAEAARARALLEGKPQAAASPVASDGERFIVQVGAFADADKVREVRAKLERAGLKTYAQAVQTKDGARTRVRLGPFAHRAEADKALVRAKALGLDGSVLAL